MLSSPLRDSLPEHPMPTSGARAAGWPTLLVVDSDAAMLQLLVWYFEKRGFHVAPSTSLAEAKTFFPRCKQWTLVIADYHLPDGTGLELCGWIRDQVIAAPPFLLMSGSAHCPAVGPGIDLLAKPFPLQALESRVRTLLARS